MRTPYRIFLAVLGIAAIQAVIYYPRLPDVVASCFGAGGYPTGWMTKPFFFAFMAAMYGTMTLSFLVLPKEIARVRANRWNLPHRDYWLAPERREATNEHFRTQLLWFGSVTQIFLVGVMQLAIEANLRPHPVLSNSFGWMLLAYFVFAGVSWFRLFSHFARVPQSTTPYSEAPQ